MILTKENIEQWKAELDRLVHERYEVFEFSSSHSNYEWLTDWEGKTVEEFIQSFFPY